VGKLTATITLFAPALNHTVETIAFYLRHGSSCRVRIVTNFEGDNTSEHPWALYRLERTNCEIVQIGSPPRESNLFIFNLVRHGRVPNEVTAWRAKSTETAFLLSGIFYEHYKDRLRELVRSWPHYFGASRAIYQRSRMARWQTFPFYRQKPVYYSPYLHPQYFLPEELSNAFGAVKRAEQRRFRLGFLGGQQPPRRSAQLAQCRQAIDEAGITIVRSNFGSSEGANKAAWLEIGGSETTVAVDPSEYLHILADMDFCVSPPGWGRYSHRTVEAIVRGAVPILSDASAYDLDLRDGENCIIVSDGNWREATRRALVMSQSEVVRLRNSVLALREERVAPNIAAECFCSQLLG
jgi:hypothetical protein